MRDATRLVFLGGLGHSGYSHMLIPTNQTLLTGRGVAAAPKPPNWGGPGQLWGPKLV